jgi:hypothetical protein
MYHFVQFSKIKTRNGVLHSYIYLGMDMHSLANYAGTSICLIKPDFGYVTPSLPYERKTTKLEEYAAYMLISTQK